MSESLLTELMERFCVLPGVGPKSAQRMAMHLLQRERTRGLQLAQVMERAMREIGNCERCRTFTELAVCTRCQDPERDISKLCIVESPSDVLAIDRATQYKGLYFVLMGQLSPLDGIGPAELGLHVLQSRLGATGLEELIIATSSTVEGETTAHYITEMARAAQLSITRLAQGVPMGGELEFLDGGTLQYAFKGRQQV